MYNSSNLGYIQGTFTHADLAITSPDATENMLTHGNHVKVSATNMGDWAAKLQAQLKDILTNPAGADREGLIRQTVTIANQIRTGLDVDGNEKIEPISGEGGALTAYDHAYYMADMLILPFQIKLLLLSQIFVIKHPCSALRGEEPVQYSHGLFTWPYHKKPHDRSSCRILDWSVGIMG